MLKTCCACRANKPPTDFNRKARSKDGRQEICRECSAANSRRYYQNRTESHRAYVRKQRNEKRRELKRLIDELKRRFGCCACGESDIVCLEFHHRDPNTKNFPIAQAVSYEWSWEGVLVEIRKCVCLCANCHRKAHAGRFEVTEAMLCAV